MLGEGGQRLLSTRALEDNPPDCPKCAGGNTYFDGVSLFVCPDCSHDWPVAADTPQETDGESGVFHDGFGTVLQNGDSVILSKELKAGSVVLKKGTKVKSIRLGSYGDGHDISCTIPGKGAFHLKTQFVKKA
ncbi:alkylphosphonate utilization operon protein PhnA [Achlya hypogyna]|uniref:Alkylphosphonate utilization operon protein PhnA n=1 Tax=Achlya hypogyna TaxID=1202772 RepID=A0A1V9Z863_ACHHY|nr:alkylphosphonate utilization operon protein PhnA [Achlya hypogyna]